MADQVMLINAVDPEECRVAVVQDGRLEEFYTDSSLREMTLHNIYKGVVQNVEPSLQAVFVNYGAERNGFMQLNEIHPEYFNIDPPERGQVDLRRAILKGQEMLVQVTKEPSEAKGAALTTYISLAGRDVVLMPGRDHVGVSRKIEDEAERQRLKELAKDLSVPEGCGYIIRTVAEGRNKKDIARDLSQVVRLWEEIRRLGQEMPSPSLIYKDQDLALKTIRDHFNPDIKEILVDDPEVFQRAQEYMKVIAPRQRDLVKLHKEKRPIFARYQIEEQTEAIFSNKVKLKSGGSIVITPTEALVSIDVNSGKATKESRLENTAFRTNLEAAEEVARQLRLRDLGGLIVVDFIDMKDVKSQREVEKKLKTETKKDKAKIDLGRISKFGMLEMSRQRIRPPIEYGTYNICEHCGGRGLVRSTETTALAALRQINLRLSRGQLEKVTGRLHPAVANYLLNQKRQDLLRLEERFGARIFLEGSREILPNQIELDFIRRGADQPSTETAEESAAPENGPTAPPGADGAAV
ncbi:MAG: Rne/Rng family ribonuclease [Thermodesulfobacteriota bacterium]